MPEPGRRSAYPLLGLFVILWALGAWTAYRFYAISGADALVYAVDDAYIHLAMAENVVESGVFGLTPLQFDFASSSPLWVLTLAIGRYVTGSSALLPLLLNVIGVHLLVFLLWRVCRLPNSRWRLLAVSAITVALPLVPLVFTGMEHVWQIVISLLAVDLCTAVVARARSAGWLIALSPAISTIRYEGLLLSAAIVGLLLLHRRLKPALGTAVGALTPIVALGLWSRSQGGFFLPTSVVLKAAPPPLAGPLDVLRYPFLGLDRLQDAPHVLGLLVLGTLALALSPRSPRPWSQARCYLTMAIASTLVHAHFARIGPHFQRYEAWLELLLAVSVVMSIPDLQTALRSTGGRIPGSRLATVLLISMLLFPLAGLTFHWNRITPRAMTNIHRQQVQMARFVDRYYRLQPVAANDVGAIDYFADLDLVDLFGLGSIEIARSRRSGGYDTETMARVAAQRGVVIAMVYRTWFDGAFLPKLPTHWIEVGDWRIEDNVICGSDTVTFYATSRPEARRLAENLERFSGDLPPGVSQRIR